MVAGNYPICLGKKGTNEREAEVKKKRGQYKRDEGKNTVTKSLKLQSECDLSAFT